MSPQLPLRRAYEQDPQKTRQWKQEVFPGIRARAKAEGAATWASAGLTPVVAGTGARRSVSMVSMVSAVSARGELHFWVQLGGITAGDFAVFCRKLMANGGRPMFLILDNSRVHRAKIITRLAADSGGGLTLFFLPPYSPELNPDEWVWKNIKADHAGRAAVRSHDDLYYLATAALERLHRAPALVRRFFADPVLRYISDCAA